MKNMFLEVGLWFVWYPLRTLLRYLPMKSNYFLAHLSSPFFYIFFKKRRNIVKEEVSKLYGERIDEKTAKKIVRNSFDIFLKRQLENLLFGDFTKSRLEHITSIDGIDNLNRALEKGKGVILLLSHFGSFLLPLPVLGLNGYKVVQVVGKPLLEGRAPIQKKIFELKKRELSKFPIQFIQTNHYLGPIVKALCNNEIIVIAFDGRTGTKWIRVQLLNRTAQFSPGPFNLAIKTGATILPTFVVRNKNDKHRIILEPPLELEITDDKEETLKINTMKYARIFERYLLNYPCHFTMTLYGVRTEAEKGLNQPLFVN
jgi:KDO2-lipid IV(A) lauroyltransferase